MNTKTLSAQSLDLIDQYINFKVTNSGTGLNGEKAIIKIPYYNNRRGGIKTALRVHVGKGNPKEIYDEIVNICKIKKISLSSLSSFYLTKLMVDEGIGTDCSALAYYILDSESRARGKGLLDKKLSFPFVTNFFFKLRVKMRPVENTDVLSLAHSKNSRNILLKDTEPGDMIIFEKERRNHVAIIHSVDYQNFVPIAIHYTHAIAYPTDGEYGHGVRQGNIIITDINKDIVSQAWDDTELSNVLNTYKISLNRLNHF